MLDYLLHYFSIYRIVQDDHGRKININSVNYEHLFFI